MTELLGDVLFCLWCGVLVVLLLVSGALYQGGQGEANGAAFFGKCGLYAFGAMFALSLLLRWLL